MSNTTPVSARARIDAILDDNSFVEIGAGVKAREPPPESGSRQ